MKTSGVDQFDLQSSASLLTKPPSIVVFFPSCQESPPATICCLMDLQCKDVPGSTRLYGVVVVAAAVVSSGTVIRT